MNMCANHAEKAAVDYGLDTRSILLELGNRFALSQTIRELLEVAEPHPAILPMDIPARMHNSYPTANLLNQPQTALCRDF